MGKITIEVTSPNLTDDELCDLLMGKGLEGSSPIGDVLTKVTKYYTMTVKDYKGTTLMGQAGLS